MMFRAMIAKKRTSLTADGNGSFKRSLQPGSYFVMIRSKHRQAMTVCESSGKIIIKKSRLKVATKLAQTRNSTLSKRINLIVSDAHLPITPRSIQQWQLALETSGRAPNDLGRLSDQTRQKPNAISDPVAVFALFIQKQ